MPTPNSVPESTQGPAGLTVRAARDTDCDMLLEWRNAPATRKMSVSQDEISPETHRQWFADVLADPSRQLVIVELQGHPAGTVRFDTLPGRDAVEISITLAPACHGKRLSLPILQHAIKGLNLPAQKLFARVRYENVASLKLFRRAGFAETTGSDGLAHFQMPTETRQ